MSPIAEPELARLAAAAGRALLAAGLRAVTAESCTGGGVASALTDVPGSSQWFERGYVTYSNAAKMHDLGVTREALQTPRGGSPAVAEQMVLGALRVSGAEVAVAITGIAGPDGGKPGKAGRARLPGGRAPRRSRARAAGAVCGGRAAVRSARGGRGAPAAWRRRRNAEEFRGKSP